MIFTFPVWLGSAIVLLLAAAFFRVRRLSSIPGPLLASLTDYWRFSLTQQGEYEGELRELHRRHGPFVRIGPNSVSIADHAAVPVVHSMHGEFKKAYSYLTLRALVAGKIIGTVVDIQDEAQVSALKRAVGAAFATKNLLDYESDVDRTLEGLVQTIRHRRTVPLLEVLLQFQADFLMGAAFSKETEYVRGDRDTTPISADTRFQTWIKWQSMPGLHWLLYQSPLCPAWYQSRPVKPAAWTVMAAEEMSNRVKLEFADSKSVSSKKPDLLAKFLAGGERRKDTVSNELITKMVSSTVAAGFDTSAYTIVTALYDLMKNPEAMKRLRTEINVNFNAGKLSDPPMFTETDQWEYLGAVIKESMRIRPFLRTPLEREVPAEGTEIAGQFIPGGTTVSIAMWNVHRDIAVFGKDPNEFRPERWLEADSQRKLLMERSVLGFGAGKRVCLGRHIAELEMKKVIPKLLMDFEVRDLPLWSRSVLPSWINKTFDADLGLAFHRFLSRTRVTSWRTGVSFRPFHRRLRLFSRTECSLGG